MTQLDLAKNKKISALMKKVAAKEAVSAEFIRSNIARGRIVIPANKKHFTLKNPCAVGKGLSTKVNANIGTSDAYSSISAELRKLEVCIKFKADAVMDLSTGGNIPLIRRKIIAKSPIPVGTVPIYEVMANAKKSKINIEDVQVKDMLDVLQQQADDGVDFFTIHAGVTKASLKTLTQNKRLTGIVSRGGALMAKWIKANKKENPFYEHFDKVLSILKKNDVTLSLGDGLRPGSIIDATDKAQLKELYILGKLSKRAQSFGVGVMIEGPGHIPLDQIKKNIDIQKRVCNEAPFYVLGPLVTDIGCGYDHITSAIGGALASSYGADFLCYVTPSEHLGLPDCEEVKEGIIATRIAAHAGDLVKNKPRAIKKDYQMSKFRKQRNWEKQISLSLDPEHAEKIYSKIKAGKSDVCSMCGEFCPMKLT